jgi:hypothetical protein
MATIGNASTIASVPAVESCSSTSTAWTALSPPTIHAVRPDPAPAPGHPSEQCEVQPHHQRGRGGDGEDVAPPPQQRNRRPQEDRQHPDRVRIHRVRHRSLRDGGPHLVVRHSDVGHHQHRAERGEAAREQPVAELDTA